MSVLRLVLRPGGGRGAARGAAPMVGRLLCLVAASASMAMIVGCGGGSDELRGVERPQPLQVGDVSMTEVSSGQVGAPRAFRAAPGELLVVYFGYTSCPDVCPTTLADVATAVRDLGSSGTRVSLAMATVDPERDTPDVLSAYVRHFSDRPIALRPADAAELQRAEDAFLVSSSVTKAPDGTVEVSHTAITYVVDRGGAVRAEWPFGTKPNDMAHDLRILLRRAGKEQT